MSGGRLSRVILVLGIVGILVASYLTYVHYAGLKPFCPVSHGCEVVQSSQYATVMGVPVSAFGLVGYVLILFSLRIREELGRIVGLALAAFGFAYSMYLTYLELFRIKAICWWCVSSALIMTILLVLMALRLIMAEHSDKPTE